jgi:mannose/cellobiose epimerase-like protein (N-acyl-D-glucosamine 2-epimerase family)
VKRRKLCNFGNAIRNANPNPILLHARLYVLEFQDSAEAEHSANVIAENMWAQCNIDGNQHQLMEAIVDHKSDEHAVQRIHGYVTSTAGST